MKRTAEALRRVLQEEQAVEFRDGGNILVVGGQSEKIHVDDRLGIELSLLAHGDDRLFQADRVGVEGVGADIVEYGSRAQDRYHLAAGEEGEIRHEHRVSGSDAPGHQ